MDRRRKAALELIVEKPGTTLTDETYFVFYGDHDGSEKSAGFMIREGFEKAERTAQLLYDCGYRFSEVRHAMSLGEVPHPSGII